MSFGAHSKRFDGGRGSEQLSTGCDDQESRSASLSKLRVLTMGDAMPGKNETGDHGDCNMGAKSINVHNVEYYALLRTSTNNRYIACGIRRGSGNSDAADAQNRRDRRVASKRHLPSGARMKTASSSARRRK